MELNIQIMDWLTQLVRDNNNRKELCNYLHWSLFLNDYTPGDFMKE